MFQKAWLRSLYSSVAEHWSCKPGVESSILSGGIDFFFIVTYYYHYYYFLFTNTRRKSFTHSISYPCPNHPCPSCSQQALPTIRKLLVPLALPPPLPTSCATMVGAPALVSGATASNADHEETFEVFLSNFERGTVKRGMMEVDMEPRYNLRSKLWTLYLSCQFNIKCVAFSDN